MANQSDARTVNIDPLAPPTAAPIRAMIPRILEQVREDVRGQLHTTLHDMTVVADKATADFFKELRRVQLSADGRTDKYNETIADTSAMMHVQVDAVAQPYRDHWAQLKADVRNVPEINFMVASEIRNELRKMDNGDRELFVSRTDDPEVAAAILAGPKAFPLVSDDATEKMLANVAKRLYPQKVALMDDAETIISALENVRDMLIRHLKQVMR